MGTSYQRVPAVRRAVALVIAIAGLAGAPAAALAAVGDVIRTVVLPVSDGASRFCLSGIGTSVAIVPGAAVGLPQEPVLLVTSCYASNFGGEAEQAQASSPYRLLPDRNMLFTGIMCSCVHRRRQP